MRYFYIHLFLFIYLSNLYQNSSNQFYSYWSIFLGANFFLTLTDYFFYHFITVNFICKFLEDSLSLNSEDVSEKINQSKEHSNMEPPVTSQQQQQQQRNGQTTSKQSGTASPAGSQNVPRGNTPAVDNKPLTPPMKKKKI